MVSLKLVKFSFLLFYVILHTKARSILKKIIEQLDNLLKYPGWKNLNDVSYVTRYCKKQFLQNLIESPTHKYKGEQKIRALTIFLGCTYAKVMYNLISIIFHYRQNCEKLIKQNNDIINGCICTEELINIIATLIIPISTLMKGAMVALDLLHNVPWSTILTQSYMISPILDRIGNILDKLNEKSLSRIFEDINNETKFYCEYVPYDTNDLWNEWVQEYKIIIDQDVILVFFKFLTIKIKDYIKTVIEEKYFQLGFKFNPIIEETFIPTPEEIIDLDLEFNNR
ncbi:uncharacterized protein LOC126907065 isoform X2 [Daktulosphaira vitifoliae]|uniref:uncharacterized protein LOC126907065 isoform X2 n=1 Tax=Daktulosphaira vitifoliae TaxID=58002 RepID=UPI0021AA4BDA|nr:uncharacterized protein LOC126907065 isoform X2 [Daktulosphaira vitifoliae]